MSDDSPATRSYPVLVHFRQKDPRTGKSVHYDPNGDYDEETGLGWPGARKTWSGVPGSDEVQELLDGAGGDKGPLIRDPDEDKKPAARPAASKPATDTAKSATDTKES